MTDQGAIHRGISQRELDAIWRTHGGEIQDIRRTGERRYHHPVKGKTSRAYSVRRKDAAVALVSFVRQTLNLGAGDSPCASRREPPQSACDVSSIAQPDSQGTGERVGASRPNVARVTLGITRTVFLVGRYAIKVPCGRYGWAKWLRGLLANLQERQWSRAKIAGLCPVVFSDPLGLVVVMPRVDILDEPLHAVTFERFTNRTGVRLPVENKADSFGYLNGWLVAVDYGN